jgi:hypothetical protein
MGHRQVGGDVNMALAGASVTLKHQGENATRLFFFLTLGVVVLCGWLMAEITRRMTAARNDALAPQKYLSERGINLVGITEKKPPEKYKWTYDEEELVIYGLILVASIAPAFLLCWF